MQKSKKRKSNIKPVHKPYLTGAPLDHTCVKSILFTMLASLGMMPALLIIGGMMMWDQKILSMIINIALMGCVYSLFFYNGASRGTLGINQGEILYSRREKNMSVDPRELEVCYHPAKGWLIGLLGCLPMALCGVVLGLVARQQMTSFGALPSWISSLTATEEIGDPLAYYRVAVPLGVEGVLRMMIRMALMPVVNIIGAENTSALLMMERLSALLLLLPGVAYGAGYMQGESIRSKVHTDIALGKKKRKSKNKKQMQAKKKQQIHRSKGPEQLN